MNDLKQLVSFLGFFLYASTMVVGQSAPVAELRPIGSGGSTRQSNRPDAPSDNGLDSEGLRAKVHSLTRQEFESLPPIQRYREYPSDQFLIPWQSLRTGHPYLGTGSKRPHTGAHLYFNILERPLDPKHPELYPPIYAVVDGFVTRIDEAFRLRPVFFQHVGKTRANVRYGVDITFAKNGGQPVSFHYSIEPMVDPGDLHFYLPFLRVSVGQFVRKGDVIATMYLPPTREDADNSHIHFNLLCGRDFQSPSLFDPTIENNFASTWDPQRLREDWPIPPHMGYKLAPTEDPFQKR